MEGQQHTASRQQAVTPDNLVPGTIIRVPGAYHPTHPGRPYCLEIIGLISVSKETGATPSPGSYGHGATSPTRQASWPTAPA